MAKSNIGDKLRLSELEKMEYLAASYKSEKDIKRKHVFYINLVQESLKLVRKVISGFYPLYAGISRDDLIQIGAIGALKAIEAYELTGKGSFKSYVTKFIKGEILHYLRDKANIVKIPREMITNIAKIKNAIKELTLTGSGDLSAETISKSTGIDKKKVEEILNNDLSNGVISLDQKIYSPDGMETLADIVQDVGEISYAELYDNKKMLEFALNKLSKKEKDIISDYYINDKSKKQIAQETGISQMQVGRIIKKALNKMYCVIQNDLTEDKNNS